MDPTGFLGRIPLKPHQMTERVTPTKHVIVLCHMGVPRVSAEEWCLKIGGLVKQPLRLDYRDLLQRRAVDVHTIHQCAGSPLEPTVPKRRICNVVWRGVPLAALFEECGVDPEARYVCSTGCDWGTFGGQECEEYTKDLPIDRVGEDVLLAYEMNGEPLQPESGYPVRLVVPGFYGTNSVKWLFRIELSDRRAIGPFTTTWYNDPILDEKGAEIGRKPVWRIAPESVIVAPAPDERIVRGGLTKVWGWAWADGGVSRVDFSFDSGLSWLGTDLEKPMGRAWQKFSCSWMPENSGDYELICRAVSLDGVVQPMDRARNAVHRVRIAVC